MRMRLLAILVFLAAEIPVRGQNSPPVFNPAKSYYLALGNSTTPQEPSFGIDFNTNGRNPNPPEPLGDPEKNQRCNADLIFRNNEGVVAAQTRVLLAAGAADFRYLNMYTQVSRLGERAAIVPSLYPATLRQPQWVHGFNAGARSINRLDHHLFFRSRTTRRYFRSRVIAEVKL